MTLVLASGSRIRADMLRNAGILFDVYPANVDESAIREALIKTATPSEIAQTLADEKALQVSEHFPDALVLGADQILVCDGRLFEKPTDLEDARGQLRFLRGKRHDLLSAASVFSNGQKLWGTVGRVGLSMREFSDTFLEGYIHAQGDDLLTTVGAYKLEKAGAQLFMSIEGDYFTVLGLPLLEVLDFLRTRKIGLT